MKLSAAERSQLPSFIIGGGMKCGTSTMHYLLNKHPTIFIPGSSENEPHFFTIDDIEQNPDFFLKSKQGWPCWDFEKNLNDYLRWYITFFNAAQKNQVIGEDCVSYLSSKKAPARIASLLPDVKLIFILRDPVERTYSQYWHWVKTNRAIYDFENTLQFSPSHLIQRSLYREHVERFLNHFRRDKIKFILFESFITDVQQTVNQICNFLGVEKSIDVTLFESHINKALVPRSITMQLWFNRIFKTRYSGRKYQCYHLPDASPDNYPNFPPLSLKIFQKINLTSKKRYPPMKAETRHFLQCFFQKENRGLSDLIEIPVEKFWPYMQNH